MDDWQVGDLALCINEAPCPIFGSALRRRGRVYLVIEVKVLKDYAGRDETGLRMDRDNPVHPTRNIIGYSNAICFRKIRPLSDEERDSFVADLKHPVEA